MSQWEYLVKPLRRKTPLREHPDFEVQLQSHINQLGRDGWEVFHVQANDRTPDTVTVWAKRRAEG